VAEVIEIMSSIAASSVADALKWMATEMLMTFRS
jgi:hypothetical protein